MHAANQSIPQESKSEEKQNSLSNLPADLLSELPIDSQLDLPIDSLVDLPTDLLFKLPDDAYHKAVFEGKLSILSGKLSVFSKRHTIYKTTLLCFAFQGNHLDVIEFILKQNHILFSHRDGLNWTPQFGLEYCIDVKTISSHPSIITLYQQKIILLAKEALTKDEESKTDAALLCLGLIEFYNKNTYEIPEALKSIFTEISAQIKSPFLQNLVFLKHVKCSLVYPNEILSHCKFTSLERWADDNQKRVLSDYLQAAGLSLFHVKLQTALSYFQQAMNILTTIDNDKEHIKITKKIYDLSDRQNKAAMKYASPPVPDYKKALKYSEAAIKTLETIPSESETDEYFKLLACYQKNIATYFAELNPPDWQQAVDYAEQTIATWKSIKTAKQTLNKPINQTPPHHWINNLAFYLKNLALEFSSANNYLKAIDCQKKAIENLEWLQNNEPQNTDIHYGLAMVQKDMASNYYSLSHHQTALHYFQQAVNNLAAVKTREQQDTNMLYEWAYDLAKYQKKAACEYYENINHETILSYLKAAIKNLELIPEKKIKHLRLLIDLSVEIDLHINKHCPDIGQAITYTEQAINSLELIPTKNDKDITNLYQWIIELSIRQNDAGLKLWKTRPPDFKQALIHHKVSINISQSLVITIEQHKTALMLAIFHINLSACYKNINPPNWEQALYHNNQAINLLKPFADKEGSQETLDRWAVKLADCQKQIDLTNNKDSDAKDDKHASTDDQPSAHTARRLSR